MWYSQPPEVVKSAQAGHLHAFAPTPPLDAQGFATLFGRDAYLNFKEPLRISALQLWQHRLRILVIRC